jgi:nitroreductase
MAANTSNTVIKAILDRRSIRSFENRDLTQEEIEQLRQAVMAVPTAYEYAGIKIHFYS